MKMKILIGIIALLLLISGYLFIRLTNLQKAYTWAYGQYKYNSDIVNSLGTCTLSNGAKVYVHNQTECNQANQVRVQYIPQAPAFHSANCYTSPYGTTSCYGF